MSKEKEAREILTGLQTGTLGRRDFVLRALGLGLSLTTIGAVLQACSGGEETPKPPGDGTGPGEGKAPATDPAANAGAGEMEKELNIYNWSDYIAEDTVANFEKETGVKVRYETYESNEELLAKLRAGVSGFDLVVPSGYVVPVFKELGLAHPIEKAQLKNWGNLSPLFLNRKGDPGDAISVPWQWGTTGIAYRSDKITTPPDSWAIFHDAAHKGKMTMMDDSRDVIGSWLKFRGKSLNSKDQAELDQAKQDAIAAKANLKAFMSAPVKGSLMAGDVWVAQLWNGDTAQAAREQPAIAYALPKEGATIWVDALVIPKDAPHKRAAHAFIDYILRPDVSASISNFTGYGSPNQAALAKLEVPVPYPTEEEMKRLEFPEDLGAASELWGRIWTEIKSA